MANELVTQEARLLATTDAPAELRARLDEFFRDRQLVRGRWTLSVLPTPVECRALDERGRALAARLRPMSMAMAEMDAATSEVAMLLAGYPNLKEPVRLTAGFVAMLRDLPLFAVRHACKLLREGAVDGVSPEYPPTGPLIFKLAREHAESFWEEAAKIRNVLAIHDARDRPMPARLPKVEQAISNERIEAARAEIAAGAERMRRSDLDKTKADAQAARERIEQSKREAWAKIGREPMFERDGVMLWPASVNLPADERQGADHGEM